ncbi:MAG: hypothetical protein CMP21_08770 [Rickettsiales bacterium]|nr:hypothetical protein [Rickettsiales bacterium]|tara:strand:- start:146 stop:424 length:279 start_codon:yes stop_codon:yes gene_type:complete
MTDKKKKKLRSIAKPDTTFYGSSYVLKDTFKEYDKQLKKPYIPGDNNTFEDAQKIAKSGGYDTFLWRGKSYKSSVKYKPSGSVAGRKPKEKS